VNKPPTKLDQVRGLRERQFARAGRTRLTTPDLKTIVAAAARKPKKSGRKIKSKTK
jgi:hypothetical protein